jgi:hypothetical protein
MLTKNDEKPWNYPKSSFSMLTRALSANLGENCCFVTFFIFLISLLHREHIVKIGRFH